MTKNTEKDAKHTRIAIIHDSVFNSVFKSQVIAPLQDYAQKNPEHQVIIISFEKKVLTTQEIQKVIPIAFTFIQLKKTPFMGLWSLAYSVFSLKKVLGTYKSYNIIARGPIAGYLAYKAQSRYCKQLIIQARGLLAEEYTYAHQQRKSKGMSLYHRLRAKLYHQLEQKTYGINIPNISFEAVSPALKTYLIDTFGTHEEKITVASLDIPTQWPENKKIAWREKIRNELGIPQNAYVYCYNGSAKPWQCPYEIVEFFSQEVRNNPQAILLVLSQDVVTFLDLLKKFHIPDRHYRALQIQHEHVLAYLTAADAGLLFRKPHIINWISRPTKALEYKAARLKIIHNNTVAYVAHKPRHQSRLQ